MGEINMKCKYFKKCKWYDSDNEVCTKYGGAYYGVRSAGCFRFHEEKPIKAENDTI